MGDVRGRGQSTVSSELVSGVLFIQRPGGGGGANGEAPAIRLNTSGTEVWPRHNMEASEAFRREKTDIYSPHGQTCKTCITTRMIHNIHVRCTSILLSVCLSTCVLHVWVFLYVPNMGD